MSESLKQPGVPEGKEGIKKKILVADDEEIIRELSTAVLESWGYEVETVDNGEDLLKRLNSGEKFDLVVTDNNMPKMKGIEALEEMRKNPLFDNVHVILRSGLGSPDLQKKVEKLGGIYLAKPHNNNDLKEKIKEALKENPSN